jgi:O-antigen/teichoic acid export membrane protein
MKQTVRRYGLWVGLPLGALALVSLPFLPILIRSVVGIEYGPASLTAQLIVAGSAIWLAFFWLRPLYLSMGRVATYAKLYFFSLFPYFFAFSYLAPRLGSEGMAIGYLGHTALLFLIPGIRWLK